MKTSISGNRIQRAGAVAALAAVVLWGAGCGQGSAVADREKSETLLSGTTFVAALQNTINTGENKVGDKVALRTLEDVRVNEMTVVPSGTPTSRPSMVRRSIWRSPSSLFRLQ